MNLIHSLISNYKWKLWVIWNLRPISKGLRKLVLLGHIMRLRRELDNLCFLQIICRCKLLNISSCCWVEGGHLVRRLFWLGMVNLQETVFLLSTL